MSILRNLLSEFMPHFEDRRFSSVLATPSAELIATVNGDNNAIIYINGTGSVNATYNIEGSVDGVNYFAILAYLYSGAGGAPPLPGQPIITEAVNATTIQRVLCCSVSGLSKVRVRLSAYTTGNIIVSINTTAEDSLSPYVRDQKASTLCVSTTAAVSTALTATLPAVTGLRHYIDFIKIDRVATAALTASATPVLVTTTNLPGSPVLTFGSDAGGIGIVETQILDFGSTGLSASASAATTVVAPIWTGVIWRMNISYRLGL